MHAPPKTLVEGLARLPGGNERGFRFIGMDRKERYFPYDALRREAGRRAAHLAESGLRKGQRVALVCPENHEFVLTFLGAAIGGFVPVPIYPRGAFKAMEAYYDTLEHIVTASGSSVVVGMESNRETLETVRLRLEAKGRPVRVLVAPHDFEATPGPVPMPDIRPDDLCFVQFTSGSTSKPKGVMVTHENLVANATAFLGPHGLARTADDVGVSWLPLFHDMGLIGFVLGTLLVDLPVVLLPTPTFARMPRLWLETISRFRGTITYAPNFAYQLVVKRTRNRDLDALDLSSLRVAGCGAEPIHAPTLRSFCERFAPVGLDPNALLPSYGMAESCLAITFHPRGTPMEVDRVAAAAMRDGVARPVASAESSTSDATSPDDAASLEAGSLEPEASPEVEIVSCGVPFPGHEVRIVDDGGVELPERRVGEVVVRGPSVSPGYLDAPAATAETFRDGWLHTGDLGYLADGRLYVCGRAKDLIIIRGANVYPQDLEWAVGDLPGVRRGNVCAFSVVRDGEEQLVMAAEANRADAARLRTEIRDTIHGEFGLQAAEVLIAPLGSLPKTSSGKQQRRRTKWLYERGDLALHPVETPAEHG